MDDKNYMEMAINIAKTALGSTSPNPLVGSVVVKEHKVIGMGAHLFAGGKHAEIHALDMAGKLAEGATMYVTLEPCNHFGRTPPCTESIIKSGIKKVFVACEDPNPLVSGSGIERLREAGIEVDVGLCADFAAQMNNYFNKYITKKSPWVILKTAMTLDGKIASYTGDSKWITNESSRYAVHKLRDEVDAILVGSSTVNVDNPYLTTRLDNGGRNPLRVILDSGLKIDINANVLDQKQAKTIIFCTENHNINKKKDIESRGIEVVVCQSDKDGRVDLHNTLKNLADMNICSLLVEGGSEIHASFLLEKLVDECLFFIAPKIITGRNAPSAIAGVGIELMKDAIKIKNVQFQQYGEDFCIRGNPIYS